MGRRRYLCRQVHAKKVRKARQKIALFKQGKLTQAQLPALSRRILDKGMRTSEGNAPSAKQKAPAAEARKATPSPPTKA